MLVPPAIAHQVAKTAVTAVAYQMSGDAAVGRCRPVGRRTECHARIYGGWQNLSLTVRERMLADGSIRYELRNIRDVTPSPDLAP